MEWDDSGQQRELLAEKMKRKEVKPAFTYANVANKSMTKWDVTDSRAALQVVEIGSLLQLVDNVRNKRNSLYHQTEAKVQLGEFDEIKDHVQKLIHGAGSSIPKEVSDDCQKDLETCSELQFVVVCESCTVYTTPSKRSEQQLE